MSSVPALKSGCVVPEWGGVCVDNFRSAGQASSRNVIDPEDLDSLRGIQLNRAPYAQPKCGRPHVYSDCMTFPAAGNSESRTRALQHVLWEVPCLGPSVLGIRSVTATLRNGRVALVESKDLRGAKAGSEQQEHLL